MLMRDRRMRENSKYPSRATSKYHPFGSFHQSSFEFFVSIHLIWLSILSWPESCQHINQRGRHRLTIHFAMLMSVSPHSLQRYNKFRSLLSQSSFQNLTKQKILLIKTEICRLWSPNEKLVRQKGFYAQTE